MGSVMQFKVPKYIEVENKVFGQFTFKQFVYLAGGAGMIYIVFKFTPFLIAAPIAVGIGAFAWALAFLGKEKYGRPFSEVTEAAFKYLSRARLYTWKRIPKKQTPAAETPSGTQNPLLSIPKIQAGKLSNKSQEIEVSGDDNEEMEEATGDIQDKNNPIFR